MCLVIDSNVFPAVFDSRSQGHHEYRPVLEWITTGKGFVVYGGTKYKKELARAQKYFRLFIELQKIGKLVEVDEFLVDEQAEAIANLACAKRCNDSHIIAIFCVSGCRVLCSNDRLSDEFIKTRRLYPKRQAPPSIYRSIKHKHLLCDANIVRIRNVASQANYTSKTAWVGRKRRRRSK